MSNKSRRAHRAYGGKCSSFVGLLCLWPFLCWGLKKNRYITSVNGIINAVAQLLKIGVNCHVKQNAMYFLTDVAKRIKRSQHTGLLLNKIH